MTGQRLRVVGRGPAPAEDHAVAAGDLAATLTLAAPHGHIRVFADEGPSMATLLGQVAAAHRDGQLAARQIPMKTGNSHDRRRYYLVKRAGLWG
jgi:hypothetical protein